MIESANHVSDKSPSAEFDRLMQANLSRVFNERDAAKRLDAIKELYAEDATLFEPDAVVSGHIGISRAVDALLAMLPPDFVFSSIGPALGHHGLARLIWVVGPLDGAVGMTGTDVAQFRDGRIVSLHVLLDALPTI